MITTTRTWPLILTALLLAVTASVSPRGHKIVSAYSSPPVVWICHYQDGSREKSCLIMP